VPHEKHGATLPPVHWNDSAPVVGVAASPWAGALTLRPIAIIHVYSCVVAHRANAAFCAIALRCSGVSLAARALPPFNPPNLPRACAALFFRFTVRTIA
jgi:hypothetical protein